MTFLHVTSQSSIGYKFSEATFEQVQFQSTHKIVLKATIRSRGYAIISTRISGFISYQQTRPQMCTYICVLKVFQLGSKCIKSKMARYSI